ncbi:hypothetical protein D3C85_1904060 [compost metagenome]
MKEKEKVIDTEDFTEEEIDDLISALEGDYYICDCGKNYGKKCKYPEKYRNGGCK